MTRIALGAGDYCIYAQHRAGYAAFGAANLPFAILEVEGALSPQRLRDAAEHLFSRHPVTLARIATPLTRLRPCWELPADVPGAAARAAREAVVCDDLSEAPDAQAKFDELFAARYTKAWNLATGPQARFELYALPEKRSRLVLRWPHYFTDAEGSQLLLAELARAMEESSAAGAAAVRSPVEARPPDLLAGVSFVDRMRLARRAATGQGQAGKSALGSVLLANDRAFEGFGVRRRLWKAQAFDRIRAQARAHAPLGSALHARHAAASVIRALYRLFEERGVAAREFRITFPVRVGAEPVSAGDVPARPFAGNFLAAAVLCVSRREASHRAAAAESIARQLDGFVAEKGDLAQWALLEKLALLHHMTYDYIFRWGIVNNRYSSGFSYFATHAQFPRRMAGLDVARAWFGGPITTPPAWNPVFSRIDNSLSMTLSYSRPAVSDALAERYVHLIEEELLDPS